VHPALTAGLKVGVRFLRAFFRRRAKLAIRGISRKSASSVLVGVPLQYGHTEY